MHTLRATNLKGWYELYRENCPVCGHRGGCMIHEKGHRVVCIRKTSDRPFSKNSALPSWLHFLNNGHVVDTKGVEHHTSEEKRKPMGLHQVYQTWLNHLVLEDNHFDHLTSDKRQLLPEQISARGYRSMPDKPWHSVKKVQAELRTDTLKGVPGFYHHQAKTHAFWNVIQNDGILIPFRNERNLITGFQIRKDNVQYEAVLQRGSTNKNLKAEIVKQPNTVRVIDLDSGEIILEDTLDINKKVLLSQEGEYYGFVSVKKENRYWWLSSAKRKEGTSAGSPPPVHVAIPSSKLIHWKSGELLKKDVVWLSEGGLKCDIASEHVTNAYTEEELETIGDTFIAIPGVGSWRIALPILERMGVKRVNLAFDADAMTNQFVRMHLIQCAQELASKGIELYFAVWKQADGNGIDDLFLQQKKPFLKAMQYDNTGKH